MDAAAKTSEDTASTSLHIKGTPTASQETNCIPNSQNTAKNQHSQHESPVQTSFLPTLSRYFAPRRFDGTATDSSRFQNDRRSRPDGFAGAVFLTHSGSFSGFWILF